MIPSILLILLAIWLVWRFVRRANQRRFARRLARRTQQAAWQRGVEGIKWKWPVGKDGP